MTATSFIATYQSVPADPFQVLEYTLVNGLKLFMSVNPHEPRIFTHIAIRAGSKQDPADTTGLAHYMEHMLFKGTSRIGALDWEREKVLLEHISDLYEQHRHAATEAERAQIYQEIDRISYEAALLVVPNEYDKLSVAIGADHTNAYTWLDQTVYVNEIPCNELERWMLLESERFRMMALRLFHTELETVYEEFNISQDKDFRKVGNALRAMLYPTHPYGTQTTLGRPEHLKRPSHVNIQRYFQTYYVPNNMAILLAGDFDPDEVVRLAERYFGHYRPSPVPLLHFEPQPEIKSPIRQEVFGQESPYVQLAWRLGPAASEEQVLLAAIRRMLYNKQAGLLDIHLNQMQQVLESEAWSWPNADYTTFGLYAQPREGQTLEEAEQLLLQQVVRLHQGDFDENLLKAVVKDYKLDEWKALESNADRVARMTFAYVNGIPWAQQVQRTAAMEQLTPQEIIDFSRQHLRMDNYAVVYKRQGADPNVIKVEKPPITPVPLNRDSLSAFAQEFLQLQPQPIAPWFEDFGTRIQSQPLGNGIVMDYVHNPTNPLFQLHYIYEMGKNSDPALAIAMSYLPYLGTSRWSAAQIQQKLFGLGLALNTRCQDERTYLTLSGLEESLEEGIILLETWLRELQEDADALQNVISDILLQRQNDKSDHQVILREALSAYARYGPRSPFTFRLPEPTLRALQPEQMTAYLRGLPQMEHRIYYYGQKDSAEVAQLLEKHHISYGADMKPALPLQRFEELDTPVHQVLFVDFPLVQTDVLMLSKGTPSFNATELLHQDWYNEYFGYGLSSIVFQEIREAKALAYSTYAMYSSPTRKEYAHYLRAYVGTQPDKLADAIPALLRIMEDMPIAEGQIVHTQQSVLKRMASERVLPSRLYWVVRRWQDLGIMHDFDRDIYTYLQNAHWQDLVNFQQQFVKGRAFTILVLGSRERINLNYLANFGPLRELTLEELFGY